MSAPLMYFWLILNIVVFYIMVAYGISLWGAYICWESEKEEAEIKEAMEHYVKEIVKEQKNNKMMLALEGGTRERLLAIESGEKKKKKIKKKSVSPRPKKDSDDEES
jgi:hypothetical protein